MRGPPVAILFRRLAAAICSATCGMISPCYSDLLQADSGFAGWIPVIVGSGGYFIGSSTQNGDGDSNGDGDIDTPSGNSWAIYNGPNGSLNADYTVLAHYFDGGPLTPGQTLRIRMDSGQVEDYAYSAGVGFSLVGGDQLFEFWYEPAESPNYKFGSTFGAGPGFPTGVDSGIPWTDEGIEVAFTLLNVNTYQIRVTTLGSGTVHVFDDQPLTLYNGNPISAIGIFTLGNYGGPERVVYFNNLEIIPEPGTLGLLAIAGLALGFHRARRSRSHGHRSKI
jgi:hypothetical protein